jgi:hypothetical protein
LLELAPVDTVKKQGSRFQKGRSGNPNGRPKGSRNATTLMCEAMLGGQAQAITQTLIKMALERDPIALNIAREAVQFGDDKFGADDLCVR